MPCQNSASRWTACGWKSKLAGLAGAAKTGWLGFQFPPSSQPGWRKCGGLKVKSAYTQPSHHHLLGWDAKVSVWKVQGDGEGHFWLINYGELNLLLSWALMRLDLFCSLSINSVSEAVLYGNPPSGPDRFVWGWGNFQILRGFFSWTLTWICCFMDIFWWIYTLYINRLLLDVEDTVYITLLFSLFFYSRLWWNSIVTYTVPSTRSKIL